MGRLPWTLGRFPDNYELLLHKSPVRASASSHNRSTTTTNHRRDFYLYGTFCPLTHTPVLMRWYRLHGRAVLRIAARVRPTCRMADARCGPDARAAAAGAAVRVQVLRCGGEGSGPERDFEGAEVGSGECVGADQRSRRGRVSGQVC